MAVDLTDLFTRLGLIGGTFNAINTSRGTTVPGYIDDLVATYADPDLNLLNDIWTNLSSYQSSPGSFQQYLSTLAAATVVQMVNDDTPLNQPTLTNALVELIAQMTTAVASLNRPTVSAGAPAYGATNRGTGILVATLTDGLGHVMYTPFAETISLRCTSDASLGATNFNEPFSVLTPATADPLSWLYPSSCGSGINQVMNSANPTVDNQQGQVLTNGDFENFTTNVPDNWLITTGAAGSDILAGGSAAAYYGANCLQFSYFAGTPTSALNQPFGNATTGTAYTILPDTTYAVCFRAKRSAGLSGAGALQVALVNAQTLAVLTDDAGTSNATTITASSGLTGSYAAKTATFRTPRALPAAGVALQVKIEPRPSPTAASRSTSTSWP